MLAEGGSFKRTVEIGVVLQRDEDSLEDEAPAVKRSWFSCACEQDPDVQQRDGMRRKVYWPRQ